VQPGHARILEPQLAGGRAADRQRPVERHALAAGQDQIQVHSAVARGPARAAAGIGSRELTVADGAEHRC